ncbi:MAG: SPOR domain-containing protein [Betaproteobacteria bacterium]
MEPASACQVCGAALATTPANALPPQPGGAPDQPLTAMLYQALIGPVHTDYYLRHFARFDAAGKAAVTWHWPAFFATLGWLAFRRLWGEALAFGALSVTSGLVLFGIAPLVWGVSADLVWTVCVLFLLVVGVLPALWANALYYRRCNAQVKQALMVEPDIGQACERLALRSSSRSRWWVAAGVTALSWTLLLVLGAWLWLGNAGALTAPAAAPKTARTALSGLTVQAGAAATPLQAARSAESAPSAAPPTPAPVAWAPAELASAPTAAASAAAHSASAPLPVQAAPAQPVTPHASTPMAAAPPTAKLRPRKVKADAAAQDGASESTQARHQGKYMVAAGLFAKQENVSRAYDKLQAAGLPVFTNTVQTPEGERTRVRVGPYRTHAQAQQAVQQIEKLGLPAAVMQR